MLTVDFDRLGLRPGERVLDMGCGAGRHAFEMYRRGADVVAYPSSAEGFGLPVLEAMATGACVLTTPYTAIPEVGGDAVAYAEPTRRELADALRSLLTDAPRRLRLGEAGQVRARTFTWSRTAGEHIGAYEGAQ